MRLKNRFVRTDEKTARRFSYMCLVFAVIGVFAAGSLLLAGNADPINADGIRVVTGAVSYVTDPAEETEDPLRNDVFNPEEDTVQETAAGTDRIYVYVCGEVLSPGVYELEAGARAYEALEAAGGMTGDALEGAVNLAAPLTDAQKLCIPSRAEADAYTVLSAYAEESCSTGSADTTAAKGKININTASAEELTALPGIGARRAADIIAYRSGNGGFSSPEQLKNVSGIGDAIYAGLADRICVSGKD